MPGYHLAQMNVARALAARDDPRMAGFMARLDELNALADLSPGFVWRLQTDEGNATQIRVGDDDRMLVNLSVWESVEALSDYACGSAHVAVMRRRKQWFEPHGSTYLAMWWVAEGSVPTVEEGLDRIEQLDRDGPSQHAFDFRQRFPPPE